ncbi:hypothetical protein N5D48_09680 [Pseudomonas sp. GD03858]|uniref:hypothetical protein n=1 Tax=unclassified Pseudomonas TaxID=196821 RepID=UPI00244B1E73|nr:MULTISPECIES: hypothetical protein [unclassified Pseudomonas]MDH0646715.1 hypothetical protein [Pseudomonas sp. GD03867]MDH0662670.1 hypothetical protein [Pseudomonas sp. GD03858]
MTRQMQLKDFLQRYFGVFIGAFFASIIAVAWTFALAWSAYCRSCSQDGLFPLGHGAVVRGRAWGMWLVAGMCVACMLITLPIYGHRPNLFIYTGSLLAALVALLLLNSRRYREMRMRLAEYRQQRRQARR